MTMRYLCWIFSEYLVYKIEKLYRSILYINNVGWTTFLKKVSYQRCKIVKFAEKFLTEFKMDENYSNIKQTLNLSEDIFPLYTYKDF